MSSLNKTSLQGNVDTNIYENSTQDITGQKLHDVLTNFNDSKAGLLDDNAFTGNSTVPTQTSTDNSTKIATTAFVQTNLLTKLDATIRQIASTAVYFDKPSIFINGTSPLTGNITLNTAYTQSPAMWAVMIHNQGTTPTFDSNFVQTTDSLGYVTSVNNYIEFYCVSATKILYRIKQEGNGISSVFLKKNSAITGATHTKITYDTNGLVTSGTDATTSDIAEGSNLYYTDARTRSTALTGFTSGAGTVSATDSILGAFQKIVGNISALVTGVSSVFGRTGAVTAQSGDYNTSQVTENTNLYFTNARAIASTLTSYTAGAGTVSSSDTIIGGLQKLDGNISTKANATPSVQNVTSSATVTPTSSNDMVTIIAQAVGLTLANPTGTFAEGQPLMIRIKDNGTAQTIAFGTNYRVVGITLPTTTVAGKYMYLGIMYNNVDSKWDILGLNNQA